MLRTLQWLTQPLIVWDDSAGYLPGNGFELPKDPTISFNKVDFTGENAFRPWPITLLYALMPTLTLRAFLQFAISTFAFLFFAYVIYKLRLNPIAKNSLTLTILTFGLLNEVAGWDRHFGRESFSISILVLVISLFFRIKFSELQPKTSDFLIISFSSTLLLLVKPTHLPFVLCILLSSIHTFKNKRSPIAVVLLSIIFALTILYPISYAQKSDRAWMKIIDVSTTELGFSYITSSFNPESEYLLKNLYKDAPACISYLMPTDSSENLAAPFEVIELRRTFCPEYSEWVNAKWNLWYLKFIAKNPLYAISLLKDTMQTSLQPLNVYGGSLVIPRALKELVVPSDSSNRRTNFDPLWVQSLIIFSMFLMTFLFGRLKTIVVLIDRGIEFMFIKNSMILVVGLLVSVGFGNLMLPTHQTDLSRIGTSGAIGIRILLYLIFLLVVFNANRIFFIRSGGHNNNAK